MEEGDDVGIFVGCAEIVIVGEIVETLVGHAVGETEGTTDGTVLGVSLGDEDEGDNVIGTLVIVEVGLRDGIPVGRKLLLAEGEAVGVLVVATTGNPPG